MNTLIFAAIAFSFFLNVLGTPVDQKSGAFILTAPQGYKSSFVSLPRDKPEVALKASAAVEYWICIAVSTTTLRYGWFRSGSEATSLSGAKAECASGDCDLWACVERGCVGIDYGDTTVSVSYATGFGVNDGPTAGNKALSKCQSADTGCGQPGWFCSQFIDSGPAPAPAPTTDAPTLAPTLTPLPVPTPTSNSFTSASTTRSAATIPSAASSTTPHVLTTTVHSTGTQGPVFSVAQKVLPSGTGVRMALIAGTVGVVAAVLVL
jgi:hypothetical protein